MHTGSKLTFDASVRLTRFNSSNFLLLSFLCSIPDQDWAEGKVEAVQGLGVVDENEWDVLRQVGKLQTKQDGLRPSFGKVLDPDWLL